MQTREELVSEIKDRMDRIYSDLLDENAEFETDDQKLGACYALDDMCLQVREFHKKNQIDFRQRLSEPRSDIVSDMIRESGRSLIMISKYLTRTVDDPDQRGSRAHLLVEELGEALTAIADGDEVETLDGLIDLLYVLLGTSVVLDLPLGPAFEEVHESNMTKERQPDDALGNRVRVKGPNYVPPDIKRILLDYRKSQYKPHSMSGTAASSECENCGTCLKEVWEKLERGEVIKCRGRMLQQPGHRV